MTLVGNKKITTKKSDEASLPQGVQIFGMGAKDIEVNKTQFRKAWKSYKNDPTKNMREMMSKNTDTNRVVFKTKTADGQKFQTRIRFSEKWRRRQKRRFQKE